MRELNASLDDRASLGLVRSPSCEVGAGLGLRETVVFAELTPT